jgi:preprotein translocase subunit SecE
VAKIVSFFSEAKVELGKVVWPDRKTTVASTVVVLAVSLIVGIYLGVIDFALSNVFDWIYSR